MKNLFLLIAAMLGSCAIVFGQSAEKVTRQPVIDMHVHVSKVRPGSGPLCPWFLSDMPGADPHEDFGFVQVMSSVCLGRLPAAASDEGMKNEITGRIKDMNMTMVCFGDPGVSRSWMAEVPEGRIIAGISPGQLTVEQFRDSLESVFCRYMSGVAPQ